MVFLLGALKVLHFAGLFMGGGSAFGAMMIGLTAPKLPQDHRPSLAVLGKGFKTISHVALALLISTGIVMATIEGVWGLPWFLFKLVAVIVLVIGIVTAGRAGARAMQGDAAAAARARRLGLMNHASILVILIAAVAAFH